MGLVRRPPTKNRDFQRLFLSGRKRFCIFRCNKAQLYNITQVRIESAPRLYSMLLGTGMNAAMLCCRRGHFTMDEGKPIVHVRMHRPFG